MKALILDTETTGLEEPQPIEFAYVEIDDHFDVVGKVFLQRYRPSKPLEWGAVATHHILPHELFNCPLSIECEIPQDVDFIIGHNVDFDWKVLGSPDISRIDTLSLARKLWPKLDSHKLGALSYYIFGATEAVRSSLQGAHSALTDVHLCQEILKVIIKTMGIKGLNALYVASEDARIPEIMTFGKYKGRPVAEVDRGWQKWYRGTEEPDPYLLLAFTRYCR